MSGSSAALQFTGPQGEKARVYFESGQVRHATAPGKEGVAAFNEIVNWKGGQISEVAGAAQSPRTIDLDWQILLMEAVREMDETRDTESTAAPAGADAAGGRKVLVIDDSLMLLSFVKEILEEANYRVVTAATAEEGLVSAARDVPDLVLLDYVLPDMKGDEVSRHLAQNTATANVRIVYMSGFGADLKPDQINNANVIGSLNKPFTSDLLLKTVEKYMPRETSAPESEGCGNRATFGRGRIRLGGAGTLPQWHPPGRQRNRLWLNLPRFEPTWPEPAETAAASEKPAWKETAEPSERRCRKPRKPLPGSPRALARPATPGGALPSHQVSQPPTILA